ncbi:MAG TPA: MmgE/PrpD family protein [Stellaceae bacterium]|nr:MmgE/PrpD family protein [Stellaceae bacterium]
MPDNPAATRQLADFVAASRWDDIPAAVRREGVRSLLNTIGCSLGGAHDEAMELAIRALSPYFGPAHACLIGRKERPDALHAAFLNAVSANVLEYDDTHLPTVMHPASPVAPPLFALADRQTIGGSHLLHAFILGVEVSCRVGNALMPNHYRRGYHITASCGIFGAGAAAAKALHLDREKTLWALGHAATQSAGLVESLGSMSKSLGVGNSAKNGLAAALLAAEGFTGAERAIEGRYGFAAVTSETVDLGKIGDGLGADWQILQNAYKPYPCGVVLFPVIDACLELRARHQLATIDRVTVRGHSLLLERTDRPVIHTGRDAKVSLQHSVAVAFLFGAAGLPEYEDARVADPAVRALAAKVEAVADDTVPVESAYVTVHAGGRTYEEHVRHGRGTPGRPMSDAELDDKVRGLVASGARFLDPDRLIAAVRGIEAEADASRIVAMTVPT